MAGWVAGAIVGGAVIGGVASNMAASKQAGAARDAANVSANTQERMLERQIEVQQPWLTAGEKALNRLTTGLEPGGEFGRKFSETDWKQDPGYAFRMSEGLKALDRTAASRGGLLSGATLKGATRYGQDLASQEYQNAFARYYAERENMMKPIQSVAGVGQTTASGVAGNIGSAGANISNALAGGITGAANAQASGTMGMANALTGGLGQGINYYQGQQMMNRLFPTNTPAAVPASGYAPAGSFGSTYGVGSPTQEWATGMGG